MPDLPITLKNSPPSPAANQQSGSMDKTQAGVGGFGNVLARQLKDSAKPEESDSVLSKNDSNQVDEQDNADTSIAEKSARALPADMLVTLIAQQNIDASAPVVTAENIPLPPALNTLTYAVDPAENPATKAEPNSQDKLGASPKPSVAPGLLLAGDTATAPANFNDSSPNFKQALPGLEQHKEPLEIFKGMGRKEAESSIGSPPTAGTLSNEAPATPLQAGLQSLLPMAGTSSNNSGIGTPIAQPAWADEFSQKVTWMATQRNQSAELHLNPPQLGPLEVVLTLHGDQASAIFTSPHAAVRDAIEQALPRLREMLANSGIMLGNAMVSDQTAKNNQQQSARTTPGEATKLDVTGMAVGDKVQETMVASRSRHHGMVDTFA